MHAIVQPESAAQAPATGPEGFDRATAGARQKLLAEGARLFSERGYAGASTRQICQAAGVNSAAIHYHFGGKEGLYREVLQAPIRQFLTQFAGFDDPQLPLEAALRRLLGAFLSPLWATDGATEAQTLRLHLREMIEPSAVFAETVLTHIRPHHEALVALLARHIGVAAPDDAVHQLVFGIVAMAQDFCMSRECMPLLAPQLLAAPNALERVLERLVGWTAVLVAHERQRRTRLEAAP